MLLMEIYALFKGKQFETVGILKDVLVGSSRVIHAIPNPRQGLDCVGVALAGDRVHILNRCAVDYIEGCECPMSSYPRRRTRRTPGMLVFASLSTSTGTNHEKPRWH